MQLVPPQQQLLSLLRLSLRPLPVCGDVAAAFWIPATDSKNILNVKELSIYVRVIPKKNTEIISIQRGRVV
jgi:hypothetical protein